jgi:transcriptional regulator with XRE-family HTH domain/tetratricopeptide (TPR) repeat protein
MAHSSRDLQVLVTLLRRRRGWSQAEMAKRAGINPSSISQYEGGDMTPSPAAIQKLAAASGVPSWVVDGILLPAIALARELAVDSPPAEGADPPSISLDAPLSAAARLGLARFLAATGEPGEDEAAALGGRPEPASGEDPWTLLPAPARAMPPVPAGLVAEFERLVERVCAESERAAACDARWSVELARLSLRVADLMPGAASARARPQGFAQAFIANAIRAGDDLRAADAALAAAWKLWRLAKSESDAGVLGEWRLLDLEASLRRDQRRFAAALDLLDRALAAAPPSAGGRILLKKAFTLEQGGEIEAALAVLAEAAPLLDAAGEPRDRMGVRFNTVVCLCHLGRHRQAEAALAELRQLVQALGNDQDLSRLRWLAARVAAGLDRRAEALAGFLTAQKDFTERGKAYNAALVSLDLAVHYLEEGRTEEVAALAIKMAWIFSARDVHRETLAALRLFRDAAAGRSLTLELARRLRDDLERGCRGARPLPPRRSPPARPRPVRRRPRPDKA